MVFTIIIERNKDGFSAHAEKVRSIVGSGETFLSCVENIKDCIETLKTTNSCPEELKTKYELIYKLV
jgi:predicted RNase H-like HicB family nuclease